MLLIFIFFFLGTAVEVTIYSSVRQAADRLKHDISTEAVKYNTYVSVWLLDKKRGMTVDRE